MTLNNLDIINNYSKEGGGLYVDGSYFLYFNNLKILNNSALIRGGGGAFYES